MSKSLKTLPNATLAIHGLFLFAVAGGIAIAIPDLQKPVFDDLIGRHRSQESWLLFALFGVLLEIALLAGMMVMIFAGYRVTREFLRDKRTRASESEMVERREADARKP